MAQADRTPPRPPIRPGPRPLPLHVLIAGTWPNSAAVLPLWRNAWHGSKPNGAASLAPWHPALKGRAEALARDLAAADPEALQAAIGQEIRRRLDAFERGVRTYRHHPYRRDLEMAPTVWRDGTTRLRDYGAIVPADSGGTPLLVVPSLINRAYILDLMEGRSFLRTLAQQGFRPFLVDWDRPGAVERGFDLSAYIAGRLGAALDRVLAIAGRPPVVIGYCMGGLLALALARLRPRDVAGLMLLATPWDFHADRPGLARALGRSVMPWMPLFDRLGELPLDVLQTLFAALDPFQVPRKFCAFARLDPESDKAKAFVALEDWLNDGVPLAVAVARECLGDWYGENTTGRGEWRVAGQVIRPDAITVPTLVVVPEQDRIVPPPSARALAKTIPGAQMLGPAFGHIGMVTSARAPVELWPHLSKWLGRCLASRPVGRLD